MNKWTLVAVWVLSVTGIARAEEGFEQHDGHAHGRAQLDLVMEGSSLLMQLHSPALNLVGFEHPARTRDEREQVMRAVAGLQQTEQMVQIAAVAGCRQQGVEVEQGLLATVAPGQAENDHDHDHDHDHEHEHGEGEGEAVQSAAVMHHADVDVSYEFHCTAPEKLDKIGLGFFARFPGIQALDVRLITPDAQRAFTLDSHHTDIGLR